MIANGGQHTLLKQAKDTVWTEILVENPHLNPAHVTLVGVHRIASLLKRWLMDTHQGSVNPEQLDCYLEEYTFRFNRRTSRSRGMLFFRLLEQSVATPPITYQKIAGLTQ